MSPYWQGGPPPPQGRNPMMRVSDADRERAIDVLKAGFAEGRLNKVEYDQRLARVYQSKTYGELQTVIVDLPQGVVPMAIPPQQPQSMVPYTFHPAPVVAPVNGSATGSLICGLLIPMTGVTAIPAVILGHKARAEIRRTGEGGEGFALAGLVLGYLAIGFGALIIMLLGMTFTLAD